MGPADGEGATRGNSGCCFSWRDLPGDADGFANSKEPSPETPPCNETGGCEGASIGEGVANCVGADFGVEVGRGVGVSTAAGVAVGRGVIVALGLGVPVGVGLGVCKGVGVDVDFGVGVGAGVGVDVGRGVALGKRGNDGVGIGVGSDQIVDDGKACSTAGSRGFSVGPGRAGCSVGFGLGLAAARDPGSNHGPACSPFAKTARNVVLPCSRSTGPSNFPRAIFPV